jgi:hypothetical protein
MTNLFILLTLLTLFTSIDSRSSDLRCEISVELMTCVYLSTKECSIEHCPLIEPPIAKPKGFFGCGTLFSKYYKDRVEDQQTRYKCNSYYLLAEKQRCEIQVLSPIDDCSTIVDRILLEYHTNINFVSSLKSFWNPKYPECEKSA